MPLPIARKKYRISSPFGEHHGLDFAVPEDTPVVSTTEGVVETTRVITRKSGQKKGSYGVYVVVRDSEGNRHYYAHLNNYFVKPGQRVQAGSLLGVSGSTGNSTGPHLHYEIRDANGKQVDPSGLVTDGVVPGYKAEAFGTRTTFSDVVDGLMDVPELDPTGILDGIAESLGVKEINDKTRASWVFSSLADENNRRIAQPFQDNDIGKIEERMGEAVFGDGEESF